MLVAVQASAALASEGGENNLFAGDIGNAVWTLVIFVLVIVVLGKFAFFLGLFGCLVGVTPDITDFHLSFFGAASDDSAQVSSSFFAEFGDWQAYDSSIAHGADTEV